MAESRQGWQSSSQITRISSNEMRNTKYSSFAVAVVIYLSFAVYLYQPHFKNFNKLQYLLVLDASGLMCIFLFEFCISVIRICPSTSPKAGLIETQQCWANFGFAMRSVRFASNAQGGNKKVEYFQISHPTFRIFSNVSKRFRIFSNVFERFVKKPAHLMRKNWKNLRVWYENSTFLKPPLKLPNPLREKDLQNPPQAPEKPRVYFWCIYN